MDLKPVVMPDKIDRDALVAAITSLGIPAWPVERLTIKPAEVIVRFARHTTSPGNGILIDGDEEIRIIPIVD